MREYLLNFIENVCILIDDVGIWRIIIFWCIGSYGNIYDHLCDVYPVVSRPVFHK